MTILIAPFSTRLLAATLIFTAIAQSHAADGYEVVSWGSNFFGQTADAPVSGDVAGLAGGLRYSLVLMGDGSVVGWGQNDYGQTVPPAGTQFTAIAAGISHSLGLKVDGSIVAWGSSTGSGTPAGYDFVAVSAGEVYSLALRLDGSIVAWGSGSAQADVPEENDFAAIAAGSRHALALRTDGSITAWGDNNVGQTNAPEGSDFIAIAAGYDHSLALKMDGSLVAWGGQEEGPGDPPTGNDFVAIAAGRWHGLALRADGSIVAWGHNGAGQIEAPAGNDFVAIAAGGWHSLALKGVAAPTAAYDLTAQVVGPNRVDLVWASNSMNADGVRIERAVAESESYSEVYIILAAANVTAFIDATAAPDASYDYRVVNFNAGGDGAPSNVVTVSTPPSNEPTIFSPPSAEPGHLVGWGPNESGQADVPAGDDFVAIAGGAGHSLALKADGSIVSWGSGSPVGTPAGNDFVAVSTFSSNSLALKADGSVIRWAGSTTVPGNDFVAISAGHSHVLALRNDGSIYFQGPTWADPGWGDRDDLTAVSAGRHHSLALSADGSVLAGDSGGWGEEIAPVGNDFVAVAAGAFHSLALKADGSILAWGSNSEGQANAPTGTDFVAIAAGRSHSLALKADGSIVGWGSNTFGQIEVPEGTGFLAIATGWNHNLAVRSAIPEIPVPAVGLMATTAGPNWVDLKWTVESTDADGFRIERSPAGTENFSEVGSVAADARDYGDSTAAADTSYIYQVVAFNAGGDAPPSNTASVSTPPEGSPHIEIQPLTQTSTAGTKITLSTSAPGGEMLTYQWYRDGLAIADATASSLTLPSLQRFHAGDYTVTVSNELGSVTSQVAQVTVNPSPPSSARLLNLSTRALALTGENVLIPGFVIQGTENKRLLIRAVGQKLTAFGLADDDVLSNPRLTLKRWNPATPPNGAYEDHATNNDWGDNANVDDIIAISTAVHAFGLDQGSGDAVLLLDLPPGQYTVVADDETGGSGVAIVELYDADDGDSARVINISNRGFVGTGGNIMIPGLVISKEGSKSLLIRAVGPRLADFGVTGALADPQMTIYRRASDGSENAILANDDWEDNPDSAHTAEVAAQVHAFALKPGSTDAALVVTLQPGIYTVHASGKAGSTGVALVEVYEVP